MRLPSKRQLRLLIGTFVVGSLVVLLVGNVGGILSQGDAAGHSIVHSQALTGDGGTEAVAAPRNHTTVITSHLNQEGEITAIGPEGTIQYYDDSNDGYWDVDPSPHGDRTITYTTAEKITDRSSGCLRDVCIRTAVEEANLTTGETRDVYSRIYPGYTDTEWHDADWINETHLLVAGIHEDRVFIVDTTSGMIVWQWEAENHYNLTDGRPYPHDWTHLNDVEYLDDGRVMASFRGMDEVLFIDPQTGVQSDWTLGSEGNYSILRGQHNPDYIPPENGGPAVLVADSDNNRFVEYQRTVDGTWRQTWVWQDWQLQWGRDADRLPNGHTLLADTHGNRVLEIDRSGDIVWQVETGTVYEVERVGTGDESTGGPAAAAAGLDSRTATSSETTSAGGPGARVATALRNSLPPLLVNGLAVVFPDWAGILDIALFLTLAGAVAVWVVLEFYWSSYFLRLPIGSEN